MPINTIFIEGSSGTGKTTIARYLAYMHLQGELSDDLINNARRVLIKEDVRKEIENADFTYIQGYPKLGYEDAVYGLDIANNGYKLANKAILNTIFNAGNSSQKYAIVIDDIHLMNIDIFLQQLVYGFQNRDEDVYYSNRNKVTVPDNILLILTTNTISGDTTNYLRWKFDRIIRLESRKDILEEYYQNSNIRDLILELYARTCSYIDQNIINEYRRDKEKYYLGHGTYMIPLTNDFLLDVAALNDLIQYQLKPYYQCLADNGVVEDMDLFIDIMDTYANVGQQPDNLIEIKKFAGKNKEEIVFDIKTAKNKFEQLVHNISDKSYADMRYVLEFIVDSMLYNRLLPSNIVFFRLFLNTQILSIKSRKNHFKCASYFTEKSQKDYYTYSSGINRSGEPRSPRSYFSSGTPKAGEWKERKDYPLYKIIKEGKEREFLCLNQFSDRNKTERNILHVPLTNAAPIVPVIFQLIDNYIGLYREQIALKGKNDATYLLWLDLEEKFWNDSFDWNNDFNAFCKRIAQLKILWLKPGDEITINEVKVNKVLNSNTPVTEEEYVECFKNTNETITVEEVKKMKSIAEYQKTMERLNIYQMILQGPPGTSKTFRGKEFIFANLDSEVYIKEKNSLTQEHLNERLQPFKLDSVDYEYDFEKIDENSNEFKKIMKGGWDLVQFHPSYSYEDFVRGIDVDVDEKTGQPTYQQVDRIIGQICKLSSCVKKYVTEHNLSHEQKLDVPKYYLLIDEINRAHLSSVLGELIYGLEYRQNYISTPYKTQSFKWDDKEKNFKKYVTQSICLDDNLIIIGTMNTADRTIDSIDYAIRRRFLFVDCQPDVEKIKSSIEYEDKDSEIEVIFYQAVSEFFNDDNKVFNNEFVKNDVRIGHTYFMRRNAKCFIEDMIDRFVYQVFPILQEYAKDGIFDIRKKREAEHSAEEFKIETSGKLLFDNILYWLSNYGESKDDGCIDDEYLKEKLTRIFESLKKENK